MSTDLSLREQIAMYLTALPCPPLPIRAGEALTTSHDLLAALLVMAMQRSAHALNETRRARQIALTEALLDALLRSRGDARAAFLACCRFTAEYIYAFEDPGHPTPEIRFLDVDEVCTGDPAHRACCSWSAAQEIQHVPDASHRKTAADFKRLSYAELMLVHAQRAAA